MTAEFITQVVSSIGLPGAILIYLIWRFDKFLTFLTGKLTTYNDEFRDIFLALKSICDELKAINHNFTFKPKK